MTVPDSCSVNTREWLIVAVRYSVSLLLPPAILWSTLQMIRSAFTDPTGQTQDVPDAVTLWAICISTLVIATYVIFELLFYRLPDGRTFLMWQEKDTGLPVEQLPLMWLFLLGCLLVFASVFGFISMCGTTTFDRHYLITGATGFACFPVFQCALKSHLLFIACRHRYIARRNDRQRMLAEAEERRQRTALIVPSKPPETFESRLNRLTSEHEQRLKQLRRVPIDEEERAYLIELETSRFKDAIRALTDPTLIIRISNTSPTGDNDNAS
jgi:hypothetical protein